jgi:hypothetical protein
VLLAINLDEYLVNVEGVAKATMAPLQAPGVDNAKLDATQSK